MTLRLVLAALTAGLAQPVMAASGGDLAAKADILVHRVQMTDEQILATSTQLELNRLGCDAGTADGIWGGGSRRALARFAEKVGADDLGAEPSEDILSLLRSERGLPCTLPPGVVAAKDRSETAELEAVRFSYTVWGTLPSDPSVAETEYGLLTCSPGRGSVPRVCKWD